MRSYFNFTLKGIQFLPVWIGFFFFFLIPVQLMLGALNELIAIDVPADGASKDFFLYLIIVLLTSFIFIFFIAKLVIGSIEYNGIKIKCDYNIIKYLGVVVSGLFLSIITFGIYIPWFIRNIIRFIVNGTSYHSNSFSFKGEGGRLFVIMTQTIFGSFLILGIILFSILDTRIDIMSPNFILIYEVVVITILVSILYLTFNWMVNIQYKELMIKLDTGFFHAIWKIAVELVTAIILVFIFSGLTSFFISQLPEDNSFTVASKIAIELILAVTTLSIYFAMAFIRLYRYFVKHTTSNIIDSKKVEMEYDGHLVDDFIFMWKQILLTAITFGIYYPWAFSRIVKRVLTQTYLSTDISTVGYQLD